MSKYSVQLTSHAVKDLKKLTPSIRQKIIKQIQALSSNRFPPQFKALVGKNVAQYRLRVGDYRILYDVYEVEQVILILRLGHRKDIYQ
jgi:mRNA interferase RelE/StbE